MTRSLFILGLSVVSLAGTKSVSARTILCRWGPKAKLAPIPGCGVPRQVQVTVPQEAWKLYFTVTDNPGLSGYNHRAKGTAAGLRPFKRKINLLGSDLFLCPADFKKERVLAFQLVSRKRLLVDRPTCRLGPPTESKSGPKATSGSDGSSQGGTSAGGAKAGGGSEGSDSSQQKKNGSISKPLVDKGQAPKAWQKIDRVARALAITALVFSILALVGVGLGIRYFQKHSDKAGSS